jgi:hypothetical protein
MSPATHTRPQHTTHTHTRTHTHTYTHEVEEVEGGRSVTLAITAINIIWNHHNIKEYIYVLQLFTISTLIVAQNELHEDDKSREYLSRGYTKALF